MNIKKEKIIAGITALFSAGIIILCVSLCKANKDVERYKSDVYALTEVMESYRTSDSMSRAETHVLRLELEDLDACIATHKKELERMGVKNKNLQNLVSAYETIVADSLKAMVHDTLFVVDNRIDTMECVDYADAYISVSGCRHKGEDTILMKVKMCDNLTIVKHRIQKKFLWWHYGTKDVKVTAQSANPYVEIKNIEYIEVAK